MRIFLLYITTILSATGFKTGLRANSWQARLDKALLSVDIGTGSRLRLLNKAVRDPKLLEDVQASTKILVEKGFGKGHPQVINTLWPVGTTARADLEGLTALRKQVPEILEEAQKQVRERPLALPDAAAVLEDLPAPTAVLNGVVSLATSSEKQKELKEEAKDLLRSTPKTLETPRYKVVRVLDGPEFLGTPAPIELRAYEEFTVARTPMGGAGDDFVGSSSAGATGFQTLASYLFGGNGNDEPMAMTMPVEITSRSSPGGEGSMAFVLPKKNAGAPPAPLAGSDVTIATVAPRLVAAKGFAGLVTDEEVQRQKAALLEALAADGALAPVDDEQISVLQYNGPLTIPWRRRNEVAVVVTEVVGEDEPASAEAAAEAPAEAEAAAEGGVVSWFDSGVRL